jgi:hypothetical protein
MSAAHPVPRFRITLSRPHGWRKVRTLIVGLSTMISGCATGLMTPLVETRTRITGEVKAPADQLGITTQGFLEGEVPAVGATVTVKGPDGESKGLSVQTDARGQFVLTDISPDRPLFLEATIPASGGKTLTLSGYVRPGQGGTIRNLHSVSSLVAAKLRTFTSTRLGGVKVDDVMRLELTLSTEMNASDVPDLSRPDGLLARFDALSSRYGTIASGLGAVTGGITTAGLPTSLDRGD